MNKSDCIERTGATAGNGYGALGQINGKTVYAHREAYELAFGPIPESMVVCHRCDNPPCINPDHLFLGTQRENIEDAKRKGRLRYIAHYGEDNGNRRLSWADIRAIREIAEQKRRPGFVRFKRGSKVTARLAEKYHVSVVMIRNIIRGDNWKAVHGIEVEEI